MKYRWLLWTSLACVAIVYIIVFLTLSNTSVDDELYNSYLEIEAYDKSTQSIGSPSEYVERMQEAIDSNMVLNDTTVGGEAGNADGSANTNITYTGEGITAEGFTVKVDPNSTRGKVITAAFSRLGYPYMYGGVGDTSWEISCLRGRRWSDPKYTAESRVGLVSYDCSGFAQYAYAQAGITIPRTSGPQCSGSYGGRVLSATAEMKPGDLAGNGGHVVMYLGDNTIIEAPETGKTIRIISMMERWGKNDFPSSYTRVSYID